MSERRNTKESLVFAVIGIAVAVVFYHASLDLPEPIFEPVGSAFVPQIMAIAAVLCAVAEIAKYLIARRKETQSNNVSSSTDETQWLQAVLKIVFVVFFAALVVVLSSRLVAFSIIAAALFFATAVATGLSRQTKPLLVAGIVGVIFGVILELVFTRVLFIDIPTLG
jgi:predicted lysophospholipase L1 biosynthesis ABC-type transport system permease subunit